MKNLLKISRFYALVAFGLFGLLSLYHLFSHRGEPAGKTGIRIEKRLQDKEAELQAILNSRRLDRLLASEGKPVFTYLAADLLQEMNARGLSIVVYRNDSLIFWTDNRLVPDPDSVELEEGPNFLKFSNGWYDLVKKSRGDTVAIGFLSVKNEFSYQNQFLENEFNPQLKIPPHAEIYQKSISGGTDISSSNGKYLFSIVLDPDKSFSKTGYVEAIGWMVILLFAYLAADTLAKHWVRRGRLGLAFSFVFFVILLFRVVTLYLKIPEAFYSMEIFASKGYPATFFFPSLGDMVINSLLGLWMIYFCFRHLKAVDFRLTNAAQKYAVSLLFIFVLYGYTDYLSSVFEGLVTRSNISFDVTNILSFSRYSILGFVILAISLYSFFLLSDLFISIFHKFRFGERQKLAVLVAGLFLFTGYKSWNGGPDILLVSNTVYLILLERFKVRRKYYLTFPTVVFILMVFAFAASLKLDKFITAREQEDRKQIALKLETAKDPVAEYLFKDVSERIKADLYIRNYFHNPVLINHFLYERIQKVYFGGYFSKYDLGVFTFNPEGKPLQGHSGIVLNDFDSIIRLRCSPTPDPHFFSLNNPYGLQTYYGRIPVFDEGVFLGTLVIELRSEFFQENNIFPELLLEGSLRLNREFANYSYSVYHDNKLVSQQGDYPYSLEPKEFLNAGEGYSFIERSDYNHLLYKPDEKTLIIVSRKSESLFKVFAIFSYIFGFLSVFLFLLYLRRSIVKNITLFNTNFRDIIKNRGILFKTRIQFSIIITVIISLLVIGYITFVYITRQYDIQQQEKLSQKMRSVLISFDKKDGVSSFNNIRDYKELPVEMGRLAEIYGSDLNLFDPEGNLVHSSQPKIYEEGLVSTKINAAAFLELGLLEKTQFIGEEQIGNLNYISAYTPVRNKENHTIGYLNLPYFENQNQYRTEISSFLTTLINVYVFIFVLVGFLAFFLANSITAPLTMIEEQLRETKIGKKMEPIEWKSNDEIGNLVQEYNRMIRELEISTNKLASTERDYAWREMAKQIAHEIKNPLTPIKLGIQHMERAWKDKDPQFDDKFERFTKTIIQQIESLTVIASQFSSFAQMPPTENKAVDLKDILRGVVNLYKDTADMSIILNYPPDVDSVVLADENQMISTFNNLIKNAIQAIPDGRKGIIDIEMLNDRDGLLVMIQDNGTGISEESKDKIFAPNFTTKNSGMGLGLAIIKNIITHANGKIWFHSSLNKGTTFYVSLPVYEQ